MVRTEITFNGRPVGYVDRDGVFWRRVRRNQVLRQPPAIALHRDVLDQLAAAGCRAVAFELDDGSLLTGPIGLFTGRGILVDRGCGEQVAVLVADFAKLSAPVWTSAVEVGK